jgi:hypothetical protein
MIIAFGDRQLRFWYSELVSFSISISALIEASQYGLAQQKDFTFSFVLMAAHSKQHEN